MNKRYVIAVSVLIALWAGFMVYRHFKGKEDGAVYRTKEYARITDVAKKSPKAGLNQMARALKKYYHDKRSYPKSLGELYPEYILNKSFIEELAWHYEPQKSDFFLSKTVMRNNKRLVAAVDKRLSPWVQTSDMVASPTIPPEKPKVEKDADEEIRISIRSREEFWKALRQKQEEQTAAYKAADEKEKIISIPQPEILTVTELETASPIEEGFAQRYLVWKNKQGTLGFGNVEYPAAPAQSRYSMGAWYSVKMPAPKKAEEPFPMAGRVAKERASEAIALDFSSNYLVWKGQRGTLGFGNVQYPQEDHVYVFETDTWVRVPETVAVSEAGPEEIYPSALEKSPERIAAEFSGKYLVWRDGQGNLGFGNVEAPRQEPVSVYETDTWIAVEKAPVLPDKEPGAARLASKSRSPGSVAPDLGHRYLVWKDREGNLGFGNVEYPEERSISYVNINGKWEKVIN